jgi:hypothetical protein
MRYEHGHTVYINKKGIPFTNAIIAGSEWGGDNLRLCGNRPVWFYWIKDIRHTTGGNWYLVAEDQIADRISV